MAMDLLGSLQVVVISLDDEPMGDVKDPLELEDDPKEDLELGELQVGQIVNDAKGEATDSSFDSGEEPEDEFDPDYDPSRDRQTNLGAEFHYVLSEPPYIWHGQLDRCILYIIWHCIQSVRSF